MHFSATYLSLISQGVHSLWGIKQGGVGKTSYFQQNASISLARWRWRLLHYFKQAANLSATCFHVELEPFRHAFASRGFVSVSWAFLFYLTFASTDCSMCVCHMSSIYLLTYLLTWHSIGRCISGRVVKCWACYREVAGSNPTHSVLPTPTQRAIPPGRLMSTCESWGVNGHTTRCTVLADSAGVRLRLQKRRLAPPCWPSRLGKDFTFTTVVWSLGFRSLSSLIVNTWRTLNRKNSYVIARFPRGSTAFLCDFSVHYFRRRSVFSEP